MISEKDLAAQIKSRSLNGVYYLYGNDPYTIAKLKRDMVRALVAPGDEVCNLHEFQGKNADVEGIAEACEGLPVFAEKLCVTVCDLDLEAEKLSESRLKLLTETVKELSDTTVLIFYTADIDICGGKKYPTAKNKKLIDAVSRAGAVCEISAKGEYDAAKVICAMAKEEGGSMDDSTARMLFRRCSGNMNLIAGECAKLSAFADGSPITEKMVEMLTPETGDAKAYNLADAVTAGNVSRAMQLYTELCESRNDPVYLLYTLTGSMNDLYRARLAIDAGHSVSDVVKDFGYSKAVEFRVKNAFSAVRRTSAARLMRCMEILSDADNDLKRGAGDPALIVERAIVQMLS